MVGSRVYVGGLPYGTSERDLERFFRGYGRMRDVLIKNGYGFVEFDDHRDADDAVYELNGKKLLGERVTVERARGTPRGRDQWSGGGRSSDSRSFERYGPPTRTNYRVIVENLSSRVSWQDLKDFMRQAGEVTYADAHKQHRNEGVVEFASYSDMKNAIEKLDDTDLNGRRIRLIEDKVTKRRRSASYSSRSRSRSRSRRSRSKSKSRSRSRSKSRSKSKSAEPKDGGRSKSRSRSRSNSRKRDNRSRSTSRRKSVDRSKSRSASPKRSKSRDRSKERSHSRSRSASKERSRSRSRSADN
ncbi:serine-arginine protein 55 [Coccinella septempunctata]|uniref:serine-arginine protein 55 n=1 Tax=Coccinella septempunctata TaxID=41139 RepID=UPI001D068F56|nr:serine-arginine protein 55 [Coccinella septempunctata]